MSISVPQPPPRRDIPFWLWPHVLSLEAPLVAILWLFGLSRLEHLSVMPGVAMGLGLTTWLIYLADRVLDTVGASEKALSIRHQFYKRWRAPLLFLVMPAASAYLAWLGLWVVPARLLTGAALQLLPIGIYLILYSISSTKVRFRLLQAGFLLLLLLVNALQIPEGIKLAISLVIAGAAILLITLRLHERVEKFFRKEVAAGILFALGCTTWTRFHDFGGPNFESWAAVFQLALLFISNLALITARETGPSAYLRAQGTVISAACITATALIAMPLGYLSYSLMPLTMAVLGGLFGLVILWQKKHRLSPEAFRVWADVIVAVPALVLLLWPTATAESAAACCM